MADEHFFPGPGDFTTGLGAAPFYGGPASPYAPLQGLDAAAAAMQGFGLAWAADLQLPDSSAAAAAAAAHFDSALSSLVSSPSHNGAGGYYGGRGGADDVAIIGDLIGRLGGICGAAAGAASASNSCYSTPLSSPPHGAASPAAVRGVSCGGRLSRVASSKSLGAGAATPPGMGSPEDDANMRSGGSTEIMRDAAPPPPPAKGGGGAARKRKAPAKGKATSSAMTPAAAAATASSKRPKLAAGVGAECKDDGGADTAEDNAAATAPEPEKGYIHVRARRGQATDSHSLAERVRRERISERMKMLESLVPGCNKITGKALMLDEIINYVQSLQRQVEFLSMKLSTMNPEVDVDARYHQTAMLAPPPQHQPAAAFPSYAAAADPSFVTAAHPPEQHQQQQLVDSCGGSFHPGSGGWDEAQEDLQSVVARHNHAAAVHGHDLSYALPPSPPAPAHGSSFRGQQQQQQLLQQLQQQGAAAARSHMKLE